MKAIRGRSALRVIATIGLAAGLLAALAPAASATTGHLYWSNYGTTPGSIGRAAVDGTHVNQDFVAGADAWDGVAVDDAHNVNQTFITGAIGPAGLAISSP